MAGRVGATIVRVGGMSSVGVGAFTKGTGTLGEVGRVAVRFEKSRG